MNKNQIPHLYFFQYLKLSKRNRIRKKLHCFWRWRRMRFRGNPIVRRTR